MSMKNNILIADDSALVRKAMCDILQSNPDYQVTETCVDGEAAFYKAKGGQVDIIIADMNLPKVNAIELVAKLEEIRKHIPVIILASSLQEDADKAFLAAGKRQVEVVKKPFRIMSAERAEFGEKLLAAVGRFARKTSTKRTSGADTLGGAAHTPVRRAAGGRKRLVAIASSTGGPQALHAMLPMLPAHIGVPVVIVQHMPKGFTASLAERIDQNAALSMKEAEDGEELKPDVIYIAPGGRHLEIVELQPGKFSCRVFDDPPVNNLRPCADVMYRSLIKCSYDEIVCVVLTGMGADGSEGIEALKKAGKQKIYTITQDEETCVVYGMPKSAFQRGLSDEVQPITGVATAITRKLGV